jgi:oligopeptide/dipeptide ABC transporter ATP-binding protein
MSSVLTVSHLTTRLSSGGHGPTILEDVSLSLEAGEVLGIVGESGSGKSMLALSVMDLLPPTIRRSSGRIRLLGTDLTGLPPAAWRARRGRDLAMIFQEPMTSLNPVMRIGRQIEEVLVMRRGLDAKAARRRAIGLLERVELSEPASRLAAYPHELSGGMRQRVMIAIALAAQPKVLIADEPTTALDVTIQAQILDLLRDLQQETGLALMLITHDLGVIAEIADRVMVLYAGRIAETAAVRTLFDAPAHPYTQALLASIPGLGPRRERLTSIEGSVPGVGLFAAGCRFAPRCPYRQPACEQGPPMPLPISEGHNVACIRPFGYSPTSPIPDEASA